MSESTINYAEYRPVRQSYLSPQTLPAATGTQEKTLHEVPALLMTKRRQTKPTRKALQNAIQTRTSELKKTAKALKKAADEILGTTFSSVDKATLNTLTEKYRETLEELEDLYTQDKWGDTTEEATRVRHSSEKHLEHAFTAISHTKTRNTQTSHKSLLSRHSSSSHRSSTTSARRIAMAEAAAAKKQAEFDRLIAEKENSMKQEQAKHQRDIALLNADKLAAIADAKLNAIEASISSDEERLTDLDATPSDIKKRIQKWINSQHEQTNDSASSSTSSRGTSKSPKESRRGAVTPPKKNVELHEEQDKSTQGQYKGQPDTGNTIKQCMESIATTNRQLVSSLARQGLPKCHPDAFSGDATLFHPWKNAFKAMIQDANTTPLQEINYLREYTKGEPQKLVDNFRKRQYKDPATLLTELWTELERRFGNSAAITTTLLKRLHGATRFNEGDREKLQSFADICTEVNSQLEYLPGLACMNYPYTIKPIVDKLPTSLRTKWEKHVVDYAERNQDCYPGFNDFARMLEKQARLKNHPNVVTVAPQRTETRPSKFNQIERTPARPQTVARVFKSDTSKEEKTDDVPNQLIKIRKHCPFHDLPGHDLTECKAFEQKTLQERTDWIRSAELCLRCLKRNHTGRNCDNPIKCKVCASDRHPTMLHIYSWKKPSENKPHGEEIRSACTALCQTNNGGLSCSKIVLVDVFLKEQPETIHRAYAIIDDQSNASMLTPDMADKLGIQGPKEKYFLSTCGMDKEVKHGRRVSGLMIRAINGEVLKLPTLIECGLIPQDKREIPTPDMVKKFPHLMDIADQIPPLDHNTNIQLLIGRDAPELLKIRASKNGPRGAPWAQLLELGWTVSGQMCLNTLGGPVHISVRRTTTGLPPIKLQRTQAEESSDTTSHQHDTRPLLTTSNSSKYEVTQCPNHFIVKERFQNYEKIANDVYFTTTDDNEVSLSCEDRRFLQIMQNSIHKNENGNWEMPLPFRSSDVTMPNNRTQALSRLKNLIRNFTRKPQLKVDYLEFMSKVFERGHAVPVPLEELVPSEERAGQVWYLPHFGVYHPKKPQQIRVVFDASAEYEGFSLNKELLPGPDQMNSLLGVLLRFRQENVAVMCDVEQMFHSFFVNPEHRNFLRFLWFKDNDPTREIVEYRMVVHLFGNTSSPAIATFGMRKTADVGEERFGPTPKEFIHRDFYVDDGLTSRPSPEEVIDLIKKSQDTLATANLRLHKVASNSVAVMEALPTEDHAKSLHDLDLQHDNLPTQRSLGILWNLEEDTFTYKVCLSGKPFTRRGVLSIINSIYDPLGFAAPVILQGKLLLRQLVTMGKAKENPLGWDDPLPGTLMHQWQFWRDGLADLENLQVPRCFHPKEFERIKRAELHAFSDASNDGIGAVIYLRLTDEEGLTSVAFVLGQSRLSPLQITTIPRLELCAAVLSTQTVKKVQKELSIQIDEVIFYTDSKVVLGYIQNETRRFYVYVANRVQIIRSISEPSQWRYIGTSTNPADIVTRGLSAKDLPSSKWLTGPEFLADQSHPTNDIPTKEEVDLDEDDPEVIRKVTTHLTKSQTERQLGSERFERFSTWSSLRRGIANLIMKLKEFKHKHDSHGQSNLSHSPSAKELQQAETVLIKTVQRESFPECIHALKEQQLSIENTFCEHGASKRSDLYRLNPFLDTEGVLRVGGRLRRSDLEFEEKHPVLLPKGHHLSKLLILHYHEKVYHQGRQITHGAIRLAGYWILGGHRMIAKILHSCITCKKLRGATLTQQMADLPIDRTTTPPPFTNVGFDVFGPWTIHTRKLRGGAINSKRWGLVFTCLNSRAIHIEVLEAMDASAFICALRRFFAIRGPATRLRCDCGTNFVGGKSELDNAMSQMDNERVERYITEQGCEWSFNPPHASHFGGVWERQIGTIRRVLDGMLIGIGSSQLTHELLTTLLAEVTGIVNARPIAAIPSDADEPQPLTPAMLLTMKTRPLLSPPGDFLPQDLYARSRWKRTQYLADQFWLRWRQEYLQNMQTRSKWNSPRPNLRNGDIVIVRDKESHRNNWTIGRVVEAIESEDKKVRKAKIVVCKGEEKKIYYRPINELVFLLSPDQD